MTEKKLEQFTFGKSPACVYLVALINQAGVYKYRKLHTKQQELNHLLGELFQAYQQGNLTLKSTLHLINIKKIEVRKKLEEMKKKHIFKAKTKEEKEQENTILNVFTNVIMMEFKKIQRELQYYHIARIKSEQQARAYSHRDGTPNFGTYKVQGFINSLPYQAEVIISTEHSPKITLSTNFVDPINNEVLFKRHNARMKRRNKKF